MDVRLDKWLWAARFFRTRQKAISAIKGGQVQVNGQRCKPSRALSVEDRIDLSIEEYPKTILVRQLSIQRRSAQLAQNLFEETQESIKAREIMEKEKTTVSGSYRQEARPTKKQRRQIMRFKDHNLI